jgi:hypothetical protein
LTGCPGKNAAVRSKSAARVAVDVAATALIVFVAILFFSLTNKGDIFCLKHLLHNFKGKEKKNNSKNKNNKKQTHYKKTKQFYEVYVLNKATQTQNLILMPKFINHKY